MTPIVPEHRSGLSRRTVLAGAAGLAGLGLLTLSGCTPARSNPTIPEAATTGAAKSGGRLRIARPAASAAETLDSASSLSAYEYLGALYNRLVKLDEEGVTVPDVAGKWSATPDGVTWTFRLRQGVTFHDGRRFTAGGAIYSIKHILDPGTGSPQGEVLAAMIGPGSREPFRGALRHMCARHGIAPRRSRARVHLGISRACRPRGRLGHQSFLHECRVGKGRGVHAQCLTTEEAHCVSAARVALARG
jgi:hypothetical protein